MNIVNDLAEFLNLPEDTVRMIFKDGYMRFFNEKCKRYQERFGKKRINEISCDEYREFFLQNQLLYFLELCGWGRYRTGMLNRLLSYFGRNDSKILDYGCGIGTNAVAIAETYQKKIDIIEPNPLSLNFSKWRLRRIGAFSDCILSSNYDVVLCWLVFEYSRDPEDDLEIIFNSLKKGGRLVYSRHFVETDATTSIYCSRHNMPYSEHFEEIAKKIGFTKIEPIPYKVFTAGIMWK